MSDRHIPEWVKNLLIIVLSLSALWLLSLTPLYIGSPLEQYVTDLFSSTESVGQASASPATTVRPAAIAVVNDHGRHAIQYDSVSVDAAFEDLSALLGMVLNTESTPFSVTEDRWRTALCDPGAYFDLNGTIPFATLSGWLQGDQVNAALTASVRRLALSYGDGPNDVWLFWQDADSGLFHACGTALSRSLLDSTLSTWVPNSAFFAFEDKAYAACDPYTLITVTPTPAVYAASTPISAVNPGAMEQVLKALAFPVNSGSSYAISGGIRYTDGNNTFQLTDAGELTYHAADVFHYPVSVREDDPTIAESIEATRRIVSDVLEPMCGDARIRLNSVRQEDETLVITYGYDLSGISVALYDTGWAAQFVVTDNFITAFTLHFRSYTATPSTTLLLPELQAAAALSALELEQSELRLSYRDTGNTTLTAGWVAH